jgi:predicted anti-sigma-YlaC factor YlaD
MTCHDICEMMPDLAAGFGEVTPDVSEHLKGCGECTTMLNEFRQTMAVLDEWEAPEPSPFFETRLQARLREEMRQQPGFMQWFRKPALALSFAVLMVASVTLVYTGHNSAKPTTEATKIIEPGSAVSDLQALDKNDDLYSDFDVLDDLQVQQDVTANP